MYSRKKEKGGGYGGGGKEEYDELPSPKKLRDLASKQGQKEGGEGSWQERNTVCFCRVRGET